MKKRTVQRELHATPEDIQRAHDIIAEDLGPDFTLVYGRLPKNVGILGDEGVRGDTLLIVNESNDPIKVFSDQYEHIGNVATKLCNEVPAATRILIDITPRDVVPKFLLDSSS